MTEAEKAAALADEARTHALVRTSPYGKLFLGTCIQCGAKNLPMGAALEPCPNQRGMSQDEALMEVMERDHEQF